MLKVNKNVNLEKLDQRLVKLDQRINKLEKEVQVVKFNMATKDELEKVKEQMVTKKDSQKMMILLDKILKNTEKLDQERILTFYRIKEIEKRLEKDEQEVKKLKVALNLS